VNGARILGTSMYAHRIHPSWHVCLSHRIVFTGPLFGSYKYFFFAALVSVLVATNNVIH
jgi:hypothetical protein